MKANPNQAGDPTITPAEARRIMAKRAEREQAPKPRIVEIDERIAEIEAELAQLRGEA